MEDFARRIRIRAPKSQNPATRTNQNRKNHKNQTKTNQKIIIFYQFLVFCCLFCIRGYPRGGFGHAGLGSDLPGPQKPAETSKTKEKRTQNKVKTFFSGPLFAYRVPLKGPI